MSASEWYRMLDTLASRGAWRGSLEVRTRARGFVRHAAHARSTMQALLLCMLALEYDAPARPPSTPTPGTLRVCHALESLVVPATEPEGSTMRASKSGKGEAVNLAKVCARTRTCTGTRPPRTSLALRPLQALAALGSPLVADTAKRLAAELGELLPAHWLSSRGLPLPSEPSRSDAPAACTGVAVLNAALYVARCAPFRTHSRRQL